MHDDSSDRPTGDREPADLPEEEFVPEDDAIIGRVFRWSLLVIAALVIVVLAGLYLMRERKAEDRIVAKEVGQIEDLVQATEEMPIVRFTDVTAASGVDFLHVSGATGQKLLPETMGGGVAFLDHDSDGDQDLLFVNSNHWPGDDVADSAPTLGLYRNDGRGGFDDVTREMGLDLELYGMGAAIGDYDDDGDPDVFVSSLGHNVMLRNDGDRFVDVTARAGTAGAGDAWSSSAGFFDYDADGDLDLFVCNYVRWSRDIDVELNFTLNGRDRAYGPPTNYEGVHSYLYRNDGSGSFTDVSESSGIQVNSSLSGSPAAKALALSFVDVDRDGHIDVLVANDTVQNFLFHNQGDGTFHEIGASSGLGFDGAGNATGAMGIDAGHYRNDEQLAVGIANFANEMSSLYVSQRALQFTDEAAGEGVGAPSRAVLSFGLFFFDYDLDGRLDLLQSNGHLEDEIQEVQASQTYRQPAQLFWNAGVDAGSCFAEVPPDRTGDLSRPIVGRGAAFADFDRDGDLDVVLTQTGGPPLLLRNEQDLGHHWLRVRLEGTHGNRDGIGAWIEIDAGGMVQRRQVMPTRSYLSQVELPVTFGLGSAGRVDGARVVWPDGSEQVFDVDGVDRLIRVRQR